jgi:hypothetical protein
LQSQEPLKADSAEGAPEGGLRKSARPGGKDLVGKTHEAPSIPWIGRANHSRPSVEVFSPGRGRPVGRPIGPPHPAEADQNPWGKSSPTRCFLPTRSLPPGHNQASRNCQSAIRHRRRPPVEPGVFLTEINGHPATNNGRRKRGIGPSAEKEEEFQKAKKLFDLW